MSATLLIAVNLVGAANGLIMSAFVLARRNSQASIALGMLLAVGSIAMAVITVEHAGLVPRQLWLYGLEDTLTLASGPLLLQYVMLSVHDRSPPIWLYLPAALYLSGMLIDEQTVRQLFPIQILMMVQIGFTCIALGVYTRWIAQVRDQPRRRHRNRFIAYVLASLIVIHVAQLVRYGFSEVSWLREIVPVVGTVAFYAFMLYALKHSRLLGRIVTSTAEGPEDPTLKKLERLMLDEQPYLNPELNLVDLARQLDLTGAILSNLLNRHRGMSFYEYLAHYRVRLHAGGHGLHCQQPVIRGVYP